MSLPKQVDAASLQRWQRQPLKGLFVMFTIATMFIRVPYYILASIPAPLRLRSSWSFKTSALVRVMRPLTWMATKAGLGVFDMVPADYNRLATGTVSGENIKGVWVEGAPQLITGRLESWVNVASVSPTRLPGYWMHRKGSSMEVEAKPEPGEKVLYGLHGGGYTQLSAHPGALTSLILRDLMPRCEGVKRSFSMEYRLSVGPPQSRHPFPTALIDALAGYNYLVNVVGFAPSNIIVVGDSAGGNIALALTRYLVEYQGNPEVRLPSLPGSLILLSPWADAGTSHVQPGSSEYTNFDTDILTDDQLDYSRFALTGPHGLGAVATNEYISPASLEISNVSFSGFPRTFIVSGGAETLRDQIRTLSDRMTKDLGAGVVYYEAKDAIHDFLCFEWFEPHRSEALQIIGKWISTP